MFSMLSDLTKSVLNVAAAPIALAVDVLTLPATACDMEGKGPFDRTAERLKQAGEAFDKAVRPE